MSNVESLHSIQNNSNGASETEIDRTKEAKKSELKTNKGHMISHNCKLNYYLLFQHNCKDAGEFLRKTPPPILVSLWKKCNLVDCCCNICIETELHSMQSIFEHLTGKKHHRAVERISSRDVLKIVMCKVCGKIYIIRDTEFASIKCEPCPDSEEVFKLLRVANKGASHKSVGKSKKHIATECQGVALVSKTIEDIFPSIRDYFKMVEMELVYVAYNPKDGILWFYSRRRRFKPQIHRRGFPLLPLLHGRAVFAVKVSDRILKDIKEDWILWKHSMLTPDTVQTLKRPQSLENDLAIITSHLEDVSMSFPHTARIIAYDIRRTLRDISNKIKWIEYFGSRITGLAFENSDFDIVICFEDIVIKDKVREIAVEDLKKYFRKSEYFVIKTVIANCRVPLIRVFHKSTGLKCDISINNVLGVTNSNLVRNILRVDRRALKLVVALKLWANSNFLYGSQFFTSYAIVWMVFYFLMQPDISLLPPIKKLFTTHQPLSQSIYSCCHGGFFTINEGLIKSVHDPNQCKFSLIELLRNFFEYYSNLNTRSIVLSTFEGTSIDRSKFIPNNVCSHKVGNINADAIKNKIFILLDPLVPSVNVCSSVNLITFNTFIDFCKSSANCLKAEKNSLDCCEQTAMKL